MKVLNPTEAEITVQIQGIQYTVPAAKEGKEGVLPNVPEKHAEYWKFKLHEFLILEEDKVVEKADVKKEAEPKEAKASKKEEEEPAKKEADAKPKK